MFGINKKKKQQAALQERAEDLLSTIRVNAEFANKARSFDFFIESYDEVIKAAEELAEIDKQTVLTGINGNIQHECSRLKRETQWHMRDALEREYDQVIEDSKHKYRNNRRLVEGCCYCFQENVEKYRNRFDKETEQFADNLLKKLFLKFNIPLDNSNTTTDLPQQGFSLSNGVFFFDDLEGTEFEYWCANLLRYNGYENVEVTQASGDQGVDIIAEKDEIRYAIQCKCYSADLDNTPIQEVFAGKDYYHCQIGAVMTNRYFTKSAKELAKATGVLLWDRDRIIKMINKTNQQ